MRSMSNLEAIQAGRSLEASVLLQLEGGMQAAGVRSRFLVSSV